MPYQGRRKGGGGAGVSLYPIIVALNKLAPPRMKDGKWWHS